VGDGELLRELFTGWLTRKLGLDRVKRVSPGCYQLLTAARHPTDKRKDVEYPRLFLAIEAHECRLRVLSDAGWRCALCKVL